MKELEKHTQEKIEVHAIRQVKRDIAPVANLKPKGGQKVYELDLTTGLITEAVYSDERIEFVVHRNLITDEEMSATPKKIKDITMKPNCMYWPAINPQNASKQFHKLLGIKYKKPNK